MHFARQLLFLMVLVSGCIRHSDVKFPPPEPRIVLHGYMSLGDTFRVTLGRTMSPVEALDDTAASIPNGWVLLFENGTFVDSLRYNPAELNYVSSHVVALSGKTYSIRAGAPGFPVVEASAAGLRPLSPASVSRTLHARTTSANQLLDDIRFQFSDPADEQNNYITAIFPPFIQSSFNCVYTYEPSVEQYKGDITPFDGSNCIFNDEILFTDHSFNGQTKEIVVSGESVTLEAYFDAQANRIYRPTLVRKSVSADYYRYFKDCIAQQNATGNPTLSQPVQIRGNVRNGFGLFTIFARQIDSIP